MHIETEKWKQTQNLMAMFEIYENKYGKFFSALGCCGTAPSAVHSIPRILISSVATPYVRHLAAHATFPLTDESMKALASIAAM